MTITHQRGEIKGKVSVNFKRESEYIYIHTHTHTHIYVYTNIFDLNFTENF